MPTGAVTLELLRGVEVERRRFDPQRASPFVNKSFSEATRRAYGRAVREFFRCAGDLRRTAITRAPERGLSYRQVQLMSQHGDPQTVMRYDHGRENLDQHAVNFLGDEEEG